MTREGYIEKIIYANEENGYSVFSVEDGDNEEIFVGCLYGIGEGLYIVAEGDYVNHPQYDIQFKFTSCEIKQPEDIQGIERYIGSGLIKGIGEVLAKKIVKKFKLDTLRIIEEEPERLAEISGISEKKARNIAASYIEKKEFQGVVIFLSKYGISTNMAIKIYMEYGDNVYNVVKENPYKIAEDIQGIGFKMADEIAVKMGIEPDSVYRLRSSIIYVLNSSGLEGHMYLPKDILLRRAVELTSREPLDMMSYIDEDMPDRFREANERMTILEDQLMELAIEGKVILKELPISEEENAMVIPIVYTSANYYTEVKIARELTDLKFGYDSDEIAVEKDILDITKAEGIELDEVQSSAVMQAITAGVAVITGGPGTGKTTTITTIIKYFANHGMNIQLCAPTGRAAKRMAEATGWPAQTIHRLLEFVGGIDGNKAATIGPNFMKNEDNPIDADAIIVDEMSMVDSYVFKALLSAISKGTRLILVGDENQLPSVGAGNVLKDMINSNCFPCTVLTKIYRQDEGSDIVYNAHKIKEGKHIEINNKSKDFFFIPRNNPTGIVKEIEELISTNLPKFLDVDPLEIQVIAPMRKYEAGVENLNEKLQALLNPPNKSKMQKERNDKIFRVGDKVMQIKNNYKLEWKVYGPNKYIREAGLGVFNGDVGVVSEINDYDQELTVLFDDGREAVYSYNGLDELEHSFAITIHKSQGSEYPAVIIPLFAGTRKLLNRNLIYTAITRAKRMVVIVGNINLVNRMIDNTEEQKRYTTLSHRIKEMDAEEI